jgi:hypothetical protein
MSIGKVHSLKKLAAQIVLLGVPTAALMFVLLQGLNESLGMLENKWLIQGESFAAGLAAALILYSFRFRFITTAGALFIGLYLLYKFSGTLPTGEFDALQIEVKVLSVIILFSLGWVTGYGFSRLGIYAIFWSLFLLGLQVVNISKSTNFTSSSLIINTASVLAYAAYIIYMSKLIRNMNEEEKYFSWFVFKRVLGFAVVIGLLLLGIFYFYQKDFTTIEKEWANKGANYDKNKGNSESMTKQNKDGSISNRDQTKLTGSLSKDKRLVFVSKLDNFFKDGKTPNPLYYTMYYFTKFDTLTQTFERDPAMPDNDLFSPEPAKIPLYFTKIDTNVIKNTHAPLARKIVNAEVYSVLLSGNDFIAPSTSFFCQPIPVPNEYKNQYRSAYRAKMYVSELNSAYFIYNPGGNKLLEAFQKERFDLLRQTKDFSALDKKFYNYYTFMPKNQEYDRIRELAAKLSANAKTPADKMLAIREYFLSKDEFGQPMYKYSDNPGIPGLPSANKLTYFLFDNRKGYCAYFAGATLFLLRSMGIPSRVAVGFSTVDRSSKNPGWYWFYEDQAHAWVQVYFPGYGWIDFDTTIPDLNTREAPQPDQTPPLNMQQAYFVADGTVTAIDTVAKRMKMDVKKIIFHDKTFETPVTQHIETDVSLATVSVDTGAVSLGYVKEGMHVTAASYAEALKNIDTTSTDSAASILKKIPKTIPVDEIKVIEPESKEQQQKKNAEKEAEPVNWVKVLLYSLIWILVAVVVVFSLPGDIYSYYYWSAKLEQDTRKKAFKTYRLTTYYLNQVGYFRTNMGPQQYARGIDAMFATNFEQFSNIYQKLKYSTATLTAAEAALVQEFYKPFIKNVHNKIPWYTQASRFYNIYNTIHFFSQPKIS